LPVLHHLHFEFRAFVFCRHDRALQRLLIKTMELRFCSVLMPQ
jgi:hypothetical protein